MKTDRMEKSLEHKSKIKVRDGSREKYLLMSEVGVKLLRIIEGGENAVRISQIFGPGLLF